MTYKSFQSKDGDFCFALFCKTKTITLHVFKGALSLSLYGGKVTQVRVGRLGNVERTSFMLTTEKQTTEVKLVRSDKVGVCISMDKSHELLTVYLTVEEYKQAKMAVLSYS